MSEDQKNPTVPFSLSSSMSNASISSADTEQSMQPVDTTSDIKASEKVTETSKHDPETSKENDTACINTKHNHEEKIKNTENTTEEIKESNPSPKDEEQSTDDVTDNTEDNTESEASDNNDQIKGNQDKSKDVNDTDSEQQIKDTTKEKEMETMGLEEKSKDAEKGSETPPTFAMTEFQILKNLAVISVGFFCLFTAFISISNLQTSLNIDNGVGPGSLSILYGALVLSCMFVPPFMIAHLGCKWTIPISMIGYVLYMGANMHAIWPLMAPAAVLLGLGAAPLWSAKCTYLTQTGVWYAQMTGQSKDAIINRFFGIFFMSFQASQISGNLVSSLIFRQSSPHINSSSEVLQRCGANFDPTLTTNNTNLERPDEEKVHIVCGVYLGFAVVAAIIVSLLLDKLPIEKDKEVKPSFHLLISSFRHLASSPAQMLLIPLTIYSGLEQAFFAGDFTRSYVTCSLGIWNVGYVSISYGVVDAICCYTFGRMVQYIGHIPFFILAAVLHGGVQVVLLLWIPDPSTIYIYYILAGLWGMGDAVIQTQINALYGLLFTDNTEPAFANYRLWESVGFIFSFAYNDYIPTYIKLYVCMSVLTVGMAGYAAVEYLQRTKSSKSYDITD